MEPLKGGLLVRTPLEEIIRIIDDHGFEDSIVSLALKWLWQQEKISIVLSGMSTIDQVKEDVEIAKVEFNLDDNIMKKIDIIWEVYFNRIKVSCTACEYCLSCPHKVSIPSIFFL